MPVTGCIVMVLSLREIEPPDFTSPRGKNCSSGDPLKSTDTISTSLIFELSSDITPLGGVADARNFS